MSNRMADSIDRVFVHALQTVKKIPRTGSARPPSADRLRLYGLYKQSMEGDVVGVMARPILTPSSQPLMTDPDAENNVASAIRSREERERVERAEIEKWDAWRSNEGLSRTEAKRRYIDTLIATMHRYASQTQEARELVSELEFVWDQVRGNNANSGSLGSGSRSRGSGDSPPGVTRGSGAGGSREGGRSRGTRDADRPSAPPAQDPGRTPEKAPMRVLRPMSEDASSLASPRSSADEDLDDPDDEDQPFEEARSSNDEHPSDVDKALVPLNSNDPAAVASRREYEIRNRKWRRRIEATLIKMTAEVAALREQIEARRFWSLKGRGKQGWLGYLGDTLYSVARHFFWDALALALLVWWARRKGDTRLEDAVQEAWRALRGKGKEVARGVGRIEKGLVGGVTKGVEWDEVQRGIKRGAEGVRRGLPSSWQLYGSR